MKKEISNYRFYKFETIMCCELGNNQNEYFFQNQN